MVRNIYSRMCIKKITKRFNCTDDDVHNAVLNRCGDELYEDVLYMEGKRGDIIDVDAIPDDEDGGDDEVMLVDPPEQQQVNALPVSSEAPAGNHCNGRYCIGNRPYHWH